MRTVVVEKPISRPGDGTWRTYIMLLKGRFFIWRFINIADVGETIFCSRGVSVYIGIEVIIRPKWQCNKSGVWALCLYRM